MSEVRGGSWEELPHVQGAVAAWVQEGRQSGGMLLFCASQQPLHTHMSDCSRWLNKQNPDINPLGTVVGRITAPPVVSTS